ncbi:protein Tube isoform X1 [Drosophila miranda]|uniref:protein Tube isoform X1 n=2 Tax=Drosophila miranda TaxID=7229 RepID=UPI0007E6D26D|nr:protein Tube isoform X1 [Drosophila miranda]
METQQTKNTLKLCCGVEEMRKCFYNAHRKAGQLETQTNNPNKGSETTPFHQKPREEHIVMAKANGWCGSSSKYTRTTELRRVEDNDIYKLATILDVNACWRKLMSIIPKGLDVQACSAAGAVKITANGGPKYTAQDISLIDGVAERLPPDQSISQVMIDEWKTSGKLNERPTVGVLLQLLVEAELFSAADFVALNFLNEPKPERPADGPAAHFSLELGDDMDVDTEATDASYLPNTAALNAAAQGSLGINLDYFDKHMVRRDKSVPQPSASVPPTAPPRSSRHQKNAASPSALTGTTSATATTPNIPNLTILNPSEQLQEPAQVEQPPPQNIPNLSILINSSAASMTTASTALENTSNGSSSTDPPNIPIITLLIDNPAEISGPVAADAVSANSTTTPTAASLNNLPMISALNLNAENGEAFHQDSGSTSSLSNDEDDDDDIDEEGDYADASLPNLSNSEQHNSNNDSSLTTVTGTSGDNSFELTNDSSSASNDDYASNIPNLSELQQ